MNGGARVSSYRWLVIGVLLGLLSALSGSLGVATWSGTAGGNAFFAILGIPYLFGTLATGSEAIGIAVSVLAWTAAAGLWRFAWGRQPDGLRAGVVAKRWWIAGGAIVLGVGTFMFVRSDRGVEAIASEAGIAVTVSDGHAFLGGPSLRILELDSRSGDIVQRSDLAVPGGASDIVVRGTFAYLVSPTGFTAVDVSDPSSPEVSGSWQWEIPGGSWLSIDVAGDLALVSHSRGTPTNDNVTHGLTLLDISDATFPVPVSTLDLPEGSDNVGDLAVSGSLAFVAARRSGLFIFDISDPSEPVLLSHYEPQSWSRGVAVDGDRVYLSVSMTTNASTVHVLDVSDPSKPTMMGGVDTRGPAQQVAVAADRLYVADHASGLKIFDVSDPSDISQLGRFRTNGMFGSCCFTANTVAVSGDLVAVGAGTRIFLLRDET